MVIYTAHAICTKENEVFVKTISSKTSCRITKEYRAITYYWDEDTWEIEKVNKQEIIPSEIYSCILTHNEHKEFIATRIAIFMEHSNPRFLTIDVQILFQ